ncbi:unnamed protein product [Oikopleura dioica]|uniref:Uncharacterized protein n=1 Tax=Oikopleura dioica TaxID=34765 RepID=E4X355_OIKDI|nr:unnamed protein product [Oikopleura dioica]
MKRKKDLETDILTDQLWLLKLESVVVDSDHRGVTIRPVFRMSVHHPVVCHMNGCSDAQIALQTWKSPKSSRSSRNDNHNESRYETPRASSKHYRRASKDTNKRVADKVISIEDKICGNIRAAADYGKKIINSYISNVTGSGDSDASTETDISNHEKLMAKRRGNTHAMSRKLRHQMIADNERNRDKERFSKNSVYCTVPGCSCGQWQWEEVLSLRQQPAPSSARTRSTVSDGDYCVHQRR